jgi:hypothetical protein
MARAGARGGVERGVPLYGCMGLLLTKRLEGKSKNDMHGRWGMVDPWMMKWFMRVMGTWAAMHEMRLGPDVTFVWN